MFFELAFELACQTWVGPAFGGAHLLWMRMVAAVRQRRVSVVPGARRSD